MPERQTSLSDLLVRVSDRYACTEQNIANAETEIFPGGKRKRTAYASDKEPSGG